MIRRDRKQAMHVRNRFRAGYDFGRLATASPALKPFVRPNAYGDLSIDYANREAVVALNRALLMLAYGLTWDVPSGYLCPPIPGRSDYLHHVADLLADDAGSIPRGPSVVVLDIGAGASCIYPLIGASEYGWRFVGTEIDPVAHRWARQLVAANAPVSGLVDVLMQPDPLECFKDVIPPGQTFAVSICNPPFHASGEDAAAGSRRKRRNLGGSKTQVLNFGGQAGELWCAGGELAFVRRLIVQSAAAAGRCRWFTTLVSKSAHLPRFRETLRDVGAMDVRTIPMAQGQKQSRILAWTFAR